MGAAVYRWLGFGSLSIEIDLSDRSSTEGNVNRHSLLFLKRSLSCHLEEKERIKSPEKEVVYASFNQNDFFQNWCDHFSY